MWKDILPLQIFKKEEDAMKIVEEKMIILGHRKQ